MREVLHCPKERGNSTLFSTNTLTHRDLKVPHQQNECCGSQLCTSQHPDSIKQTNEYCSSIRWNQIKTIIHLVHCKQQKWFTFCSFFLWPISILPSLTMYGNYKMYVRYFTFITTYDNYTWPLKESQVFVSNISTG